MLLRLSETLVDAIELTPIAAGPYTDDKTLSVNIKGHLAGILSMALQTENPLKNNGLTVESTKLVARAGFEPTDLLPIN